MSRRFSRRELFRRSAAASAAAVFTGSLRADEEKKAPPSERIGVAQIGVGGQGGFHLQNIGSQNVVALCDIDSERLAVAAKRYPNAKLFADWRRVLDLKEV